MAIPGSEGPVGQIHSRSGSASGSSGARARRGLTCGQASASQKPPARHTVAAAKLRVASHTIANKASARRSATKANVKGKAGSVKRSAGRALAATRIATKAATERVLRLNSAFVASAQLAADGAAVGVDADGGGVCRRDELCAGASGRGSGDGVSGAGACVCAGPSVCGCGGRISASGECVGRCAG